MMTQQDEDQLKLEIQHIFDSGANEIRIFEMVKNFINARNLVSDPPTGAGTEGEEE